MVMTSSPTTIVKRSFGIANYFFCLVFLVGCFSTYSQRLPKRTNPETIQSSEIKSLVDSGIDPRKYVKVFFKRRPDTKPENTLSIWRWDTLAQHQKYKVIDKDGIINIYFDKAKLASGINFKGSISLSASVKSKAGERPIEVTPNSKVGEQMKAFGTNAISPELTALLLFNAVFTIKSTLNDRDSFSGIRNI